MDLRPRLADDNCCPIYRRASATKPKTKVSSLQQHRQMGVLMRGCSSAHRIAGFGAGGPRQTRRYDPGTRDGSTRSAASMGRLTLNVLLSFALFEREVTSE